jgi:hypothetical protein
MSSPGREVNVMGESGVGGGMEGRGFSAVRVCVGAGLDISGSAGLQRCAFGLPWGPTAPWLPKGLPTFWYD